MLGPARSGGGPVELWRVDLREVTPDQAADTAAYSAVFVVNDGGARVVQRMLAACGMRERHRGLPIGVLWYVDENGARLPPGAEPRLSLALSQEGVRLEYQAD